MAIENFTSAEFEAALPAGHWKPAPDRDGQRCYTVHPFPGSLAILVWSSIDPKTGASSADPGCDSIRCVCAVDGVPFGGKAARWTDRRKGWQRRLLAVLRSLASQVKSLRRRPNCPHCGSGLVPLTVRKGVNKDRPFVACTLKECKGRKPTSAFGFFAFTDDDAENAPSVPQDAAGTVKPTDPTIPPAERQEGAKTGQEGPTHLPCDVCRKMCKVFTCGERTKTPGARFISCDRQRGGCGRWVIVDGAEEGCTVNVEPRRSITLAEAQRIQDELRAQDSEATAIGNACAERPTVRPLPPRTEASAPFALQTARRQMDSAARLIQKAIATLDEATAGGQTPDAPEKATNDLRAALRLLTGAADQKEADANSRERILRK